MDRRKFIKSAVAVSAAAAIPVAAKAATYPETYNRIAKGAASNLRWVPTDQQYRFMREGWLIVPSADGYTSPHNMYYLMRHNG